MRGAWRGQASVCGDLDQRQARKIEKRCQRCGVLIASPLLKWCGPCRADVDDERVLATRQRKQRTILTDDAFHGGEPIPAKGNWTP